MEINWTVEAKATFNEHLEYLQLNWDQSTVLKFLDRVDVVEESIVENPNLFPKYEKSENIRRCVLNKHITLYYRIVSSSRIDFITFWNTHRNPNDLKL